MDEKVEFKQWCILQIMGRVKLAGLVSEEIIAGTSFLRIDVPPTTDRPAFTRFFGASVIYSIDPVTEEFARSCAETWKSVPADIWDIKAFLNAQKQLPAPGELPFEDDY